MAWPGLARPGKARRGVARLGNARHGVARQGKARFFQPKGHKKMQTVKVRLEGRTPLMMNRFYDEAQIASTGGERATASGDRLSPEDDARRRLYLNDEGAPIVPQPMLFSAIIEAGKHFKQGKRQLTTSKSSMIPGFIDIDGIEFVLDTNGSDPAWSVDSRPVRIPATGGRILRHRPIFNAWSFDFEMLIDTDLISVNMMRDVVEAAGRRVGIGDFRPQQKGPYGKFDIVEWKRTNGDE